jgi:hypothetical protein
LVLQLLDFFYDFIWILQVAVNIQKGEESFCAQTLGKIEMLIVIPSFAQKALELRWTLQCGPWAKGYGATGRIPARPAAGMARKR